MTNALLAETRGLTVPQLLDSFVKTMPDAVPLRTPSAPGLSYREWHRRSHAAAAGLHARGLRAGGRVTLLFDGLDWLDYAVAYMAVLRCGATALHMNGHMSDAEILRRLQECDCNWIVRSPFLKSPRGFAGRDLTLADIEQSGASAPDVRVPPDAVAEIRYTSGTTGAAKGYFVSHDNLTFGRTLDAMRELSNASGMLVPMTLGTSTSATLLVIAATSPVHMVLCSPLDLEAMGELIARERIAAFMITPHIAQQVVEARLDRRHDLSSVRLVASASSPLNRTTASTLLAMMPGAKLQIACAQSEASPALLTHTYDPARPFSVGRPSAATEARVVDALGGDVAAGEVGELWLRTAAPKRLYVSAPDSNRQLIEDGWHRTGDLVRRSADGEIEFFDRKADVLERDGQPVSSIHLEAALLDLPAVREAAVVTIRGSDGAASRIAAFVALRDADALPAVREALRAAMPAAHMPDAFIAVSTLPRTHNGKVLKRDLRLNVGLC